MKAVSLLLLVAVSACTSTPPGPDYDTDQLEHLVLTERPKGTVLSGTPSHRNLEDVAHGDEVRRRRFESAGFLDMFEATFVASGADGPDGFLMTSRAYLFEDPSAGLAAIRETLEDEGGDLSPLGSPVDGRDGFGVRGQLDRELPSGVLFAWRKGNVVLVLAAIAVGPVSSGTLIRLARAIDQLEPPEASP